jgi:hypothetical protein
MTSTDPHAHGREHEHDRANGRMNNPEVGHEESDIDVRTVLSFAAGMVVVVVTCAVVIRVLFGVLDRQARASDPRLSPIARPAGQLPPEPRLETNERVALTKFRLDETKTLEGYGWVDQLGGVARIPVEEAKRLLAQRGLPARATAADPLEGTHAPAMGEASGGRTIPSKPAAGAAATPAGAQPDAAAVPGTATPAGAK